MAIMSYEIRQISFTFCEILFFQINLGERACEEQKRDLNHPRKLGSGKISVYPFNHVMIEGNFLYTIFV